jgi:hypothetical protein
MRRVAKPLIGAVTALGLATYGFDGTSGQEIKAKPAAPFTILKAAPAMDPNEAFVQQVEQSYGPQIRQVCRTELHFMRLVTQPTKPQFEKVAADGEASLKTIIREIALAMRGNPSNVSDPRTLIADAIAKSVRTTLSPDQAARYQKELDDRAAARKRTALLNLVGMVDNVLFLTTEQRDRLGEILASNWDDSWNHAQWLTISGQYFPSMPDAKILPILSAAQQNVWRGIQKGNVRFGFSLGFVQGIHIEDEVWDDDRLPEDPERAGGKAVPKAGGKK